MVDSLGTDEGPKNRIKAKWCQVNDTVQFSQEALDRLELWNKAEKDKSGHQEALQAQRDEEIRRSFEVLELEQGAPEELIRRAYHHLMKNYHPDKYSNLPPEFRKLAEAKAKQIIEAYNNLTK
jgi:DnaJ-class molecular chaperone